MTAQNMRICFVTEVDLEQIGGAVTNDRRMIRCLRKLNNVDVIYMKKMRFKSIAVALLVFMFTVLKSLSKQHVIYFSRGLVSSASLMLLKPFVHCTVIHQALSVPFPSNEVYYTPLSGFESAVRYSIFHFLEKNMLPRVDGITVASEEYADELVGIGVERGRVWVVPFSVDDAFFEQPVKENVGEVFTFCYAGLFHVYHAPVLLVQAFGLLTQRKANAELLLAGEGVSRPEVEKEVAERNLYDMIKFVGMIPPRDLPSFLSTVDCFVLLSRLPGIPIGILEAAAAGKPIITLKRKNDEALNRYFTHGKDIYMVETDSPKRIAEAMELIYEDSELRRTLAYGARKVAQRHFSEEAVISPLRSILTKYVSNCFEQ